ncbi:MAG: sodium:proton antiporter [Lachnospiraceae bacterium]|nr:sodium:proton antiporter [Lachnospiraceae bacterium]MCR5766872.1 sodium:proton antiporter [Lachnospiraceae bacterium]
MNGYVEWFLIVVTGILLVLVFACFIRAIIGPTIADRIVSINMIGTIIIMIIAVLTVLMKEAWLADISAIYAMISFLAVVVLTKIYIGVYREAKANKLNKERKSSRKKV